MTQTQEHLLKLVLEIDRLCRKHEIRYFLAFGSILGAVRHHGFIPWDNDVDLSMPEEDYERFRRVCREELDPAHRVFIDNRENREYPVVFGHYVDRDSCRMTSRTNYWDNYVGQCIDIFCMVEMPADPDQKRMAKDRFFAYDEFANRSFMHYMQKPPAVIAYYRAYQEQAEREGREAVLRALEAEIFGHHYEGADTYMLCSARSCTPDPCVPKKPFDTPAEMLFEGHPLFIPDDYVTVLEHYYGEDFNLFPRDKRIHAEMSHTELPARVYVQDFMGGSDKEKLLRDRAAAKDARVELCVKEIEQTTRFYAMQGLNIAKKLERTVRERGVDLARLAAAVDQILGISPGPFEAEALTDGRIRSLLGEADGLFDDYYRKQLKGEARYWRAHFDIGEEAEYCAMAWLWLGLGDRKGFRKHFALREDLGLPMTDRLRALKDAFDAYGQVRRYLIYHRPKEAARWLERCSVRFGARRETQIWQLCVLVQTAAEEPQIREALSLADRLLSEGREDLCVKAKADLLWKLARIEEEGAAAGEAPEAGPESIAGAGSGAGAKSAAGEAAALYRELKENCDDGFILLEIAQHDAQCHGQCAAGHGSQFNAQHDAGRDPRSEEGRAAL